MLITTERPPGRIRDEINEPVVTVRLIDGTLIRLSEGEPGELEVMMVNSPTGLGHIAVLPRSSNVVLVKDEG